MRRALAVINAGRDIEIDEIADAVEPGILARHRHRDPVRYRRAMTLRRVALAAAKASTPVPVPTIEDVARPAALEDIAQKQQAAARRAVMAGAEGECGLDSRCRSGSVSPRRGHARHARRSVPLAPGRALPRGLHPILLIERDEDGIAGALADDHADEVAHRRFVRRAGEIDLQQPRPVIMGASKAATAVSVGSNILTHGDR